MDGEQIVIYICVCMNVSSWDEERLFVQSFIWQRNCKKRDLFNGSFSSQLRALVGCNGFSNDSDTVIHTDLNINSAVASHYKAGFLVSSSEQDNHHLILRLNLPQKRLIRNVHELILLDNLTL